MERARPVGARFGPLGESDTLLQGILARPVRLGEGLVDYEDHGGVGAVARVEAASQEEGDAERLKIARADRVDAQAEIQRRAVIARGSTMFDPQGRPLAGGSERDAGVQRGGPHAC